MIISAIELLVKVLKSTTLQQKVVLIC